MAAAVRSHEISPEILSEAKKRVKELADDGAKIQINVSDPPMRYYVSAKTLFEAAKFEAEKKEYEKAYTLIVRYLELFVNRLPRHPRYKDIKESVITDNKKTWSPAMRLGEDLKAKCIRKAAEEIEEEMGRKAFLIQKYHPLPDAAHAGARNVDGIIQKISDFNRTLPSAPLDDGPAADVSWPQRDYTPPNDEEDDGGVTIDWFSPSKNKMSEEEILSHYPEINRMLKPRPKRIAAAGSQPVPPPRPSKLSVDRQFPLPSPAGILRPVQIAGDLVEKFIAAARDNTEKKNIETCGNLWGQRDDEKGDYVVTHLLIPKQKGTDSYCEDMDDMSEAAQFAISRNLIQLGWIHTHPTQTAFLSSVDLHMQWGYQAMLPEAVAIVVAPAYDDVGFFRLTDGGMQYIANCGHGTNFHSHNTTEQLFHRVDNIMINSSVAVDMKDFRFSSSV
ncbi:STAM-binding protein-like [Paramacrobiotus metropolitanus]|uniref:STAM-binding protein-like n=1 Tax=Paramacrobiotus metropolitanus TaxID=2943436 RepID=UPI00244631B0|nr:STAM-binding protein-like [Paramacrobiotus metropolitanus]